MNAPDMIIRPLNVNKVKEQKENIIEIHRQESHTLPAHKTLTQGCESQLYLSSIPILCVTVCRTHTRTSHYVVFGG